MAEIPPVSAARSVSAKIRSFSPAVNVRRFGRSDSSGLAVAGAGTTVGLRPSSVPAPATACASTTLLGMTTRQFSYALKSKLPGGCVSSSLARRGMGWVLPLVESEVEGSAGSVDVLEFDGPGDLRTLADLGLKLAQGKQLLSQVQQAVVAAQCRDHA